MPVRRPQLLDLVLAVPAFLAAGSSFSLAQPQPESNGKDLFEKRCGGCHALDRDKEGPRLGGVYGRKAGSLDSFLYSVALKNSRVTWEDRALEKWLADPEQYIPGNDMSFHVEKPAERRAIIAYLKQNSAR